jgi:two-component system chemotaxis sensor kinase CheA
VTVSVTRLGAKVAFVAGDDGRGIDLEAVRSAAARKGLLPEGGRGVSAHDLVGALLAGGITTATRVSEVAGRGVGLDVVREAAERLGGRVNVTTGAGTGTTVELVVPLSLASLEGLVVEAGGAQAVLPLDAVVRTCVVPPQDIVHAGSGESVLHEGKAVPYIRLATALFPDRGAPERPRSTPAVILRGGAGEHARDRVAVVAVDRLLGVLDLVLRPLPPLTPAAPLVAGATLDAEGKPQLVLDADALVALALRAAPAPKATIKERPPILVIDDSLTTRMLEQSILESAGYEVDVAASAEEGLEKARERRYGLFLVDIEMPGIDGFTFVERTRADATLRQTPAILVSSRADPEDKKRGREVGALSYMVKSEFDQVELLSQIRAEVG